LGEVGEIPGAMDNCSHPLETHSGINVTLG
jgi:hypothetical protein